MLLLMPLPNGSDGPQDHNLVHLTRTSLWLPRLAWQATRELLWTRWNARNLRRLPLPSSSRSSKLDDGNKQDQTPGASLVWSKRVAAYNRASPQPLNRGDVQDRGSSGGAAESPIKTFKAIMKLKIEVSAPRWPRPRWSSKREQVQQGQRSYS